MADRETPLKRQREEAQVEEILKQEETTKRHRPSSSSSYNHILSILEAENEEESNQDLSSLMTSLQQELSSSDCSPESFPGNPSSVSLSITTSECKLSNVIVSKEDEEEDKEGVIRHLLEASDDELGIPNIEVRSNGDDEVGLNAGDGFGGFGFGDGFWEFEDEAANYYTLLQSELFM